MVSEVIIKTKILLHSNLGIHIIEIYPFATTLWQKNRIELNNTQKNAMERALTNQFHLIQGPPG